MQRVVRGTKVQWLAALAASVLAAGPVFAETDARVRTLIVALRHDDPSIREQACMSLDIIGKASIEALPALITTAEKDTDPNVREEATVTLGSFIEESESALDVVIAGLKDPNLSVRLAAVRALSAPKAPPERTALPLVEALLRNRDADFGEAAYKCLQRYKPLPKQATPAVREALSSKEPFIRLIGTRLASGLSALDEDTLAELKKIADDGIKSGSFQGAELTLKALTLVISTSSPTQEQLAFLARMTKSQDRSERHAALECIVSIRNSESAAEAINKAAVN
ncbi:MAG: HEAT repeat domain-containing protein, partial [Acidobacteriota bacterium]